MVKRKLELKLSEILEATDNAMVNGIIGGVLPVKSGKTHRILSMLPGKSPNEKKHEINQF